MKKDGILMYWNSSERWHQHGHRHHGSGWLVAVVIIGLIILTHGWILILPLLLLAAIAVAAFALPKVLCNMQRHDWYSDWSSQWHEKRKRHFDNWNDWRDAEKPKRGSSDDIEYV